LDTGNKNRFDGDITPSSPVVAYLALGANLGDRRAHLSAAVTHFRARRDVTVELCSPLYETVAVAPEPQPPYLNACVRLRTLLGVRPLLALSLACERAQGRIRDPADRWAPRPLDIDILLYGNQVIRQPDLQVPHPRLLGRPFVRIPLAQVAEPGLSHPVTGEALDQAVDSEDVRKWSEGV